MQATIDKIAFVNFVTMKIIWKISEQQNVSRFTVCVSCSGILKENCAYKNFDKLAEMDCTLEISVQLLHQERLPLQLFVLLKNLSWGGQKNLSHVLV